jgi:diaminopimelate decarboxylase
MPEAGSTVSGSPASRHVVSERASAGGGWPASATFGSGGLEIGGVLAASIAERNGTPAIVIDEEEVRARCREAAALVPRVLFAVKAFTSHAMVRLALDEGLGLLCATGGEIEACLRAGAPGDRIVLHGSNKSDAELELAVRSGLAHVVADGLDEIRRLDQLARERGTEQSVLLRVVPEVDVQTHEAIATGHESSKFGTPIADVVEVARSANGFGGVRLDGLHAHIGSQVLDVTPYMRTLDVLLGLALELRDRASTTVSVIDLGGGFGVTYTDERPLLVADVAAAATAALEDRCRREDLDRPTLVIEPGRAIVANAGVTLYRIGAIKRAGGRTLAAVDGGMSDNVRPMLYDARYAVRLASAPRDEAETQRFTVVGRHCESGDVLAEDVSLPADLAPGDLLAFAATGAYTYSLASTYNRVGRPAVVAVHGGDSTVWLRREDDADLERLETGSSREPPPAPVITDVVVRSARARDARSFMTFWTRIVEEGGFVRSEQVAHSLRVYRARFRHPWTEHDAQIVAVSGERVVGHVYIQRERHPVTRHVATLGIAVAADARARGIGTALLAEAIGWARSVGVEKIVLSVYPRNTAAIALYRKFGFIDEGRLARHSRKSYGYEDEILMAVWIGGERGR